MCHTSIHRAETVTFALSRGRRKQMSDSEYGVRKTAVMLLKHGKTQEEVAQFLDRSPRWVAKWVKRFEKQSW
ncbi:MAG: helix-turn-helix domain-containing protein, partial [Anaerolineales bacterium]|nr:helix-turn-helix domain-containing protein [Anaerolineales bacterium]